MIIDSTPKLLKISL